MLQPWALMKKGKTMRLIDADKLEYDWEDGMLTIDIKSAPTVDAVEVVRCGECVYRRRCMLQHFVESNAVDGTKIDWSEWYCADGVRETE